MTAPEIPEDTLTHHPTDPEAVTPCPCCGAFSGTTLASSSAALLAVCDVLVTRALESVGKRIVRLERSRHGALAGRPWHVAHTFWLADSVLVSKALTGAWDVVPAMLSAHGGTGGVPSQDIINALDAYVRELVAARTAHRLDYLSTYLTALGLPVTYPSAHQVAPPIGTRHRTGVPA